MSLTEYHDYIGYCRQHFEEGLIRAGFIEDSSGWKGTVYHGHTSTEVIIELCSRFPFRPPRVVPVDPASVAWSWHRELDGSLCLVAEDDHEDLWWTETSTFLKHVAEWLKQAGMGWPNDRIDMDLERYFPPSSDKRLYLYDDLERYQSSFVRFRPSGNNTMRIARGTRPKNPSFDNKVRYGYVTDLGVIDTPPRSWEEVAVSNNAEVDLNRLIHRHLVSIVVLTYRRGDHEGAIALEVWPTQDGKIAARRLRAAADTEVARAARAGLLAPALQDLRVALVGVGAIGSYVADMLVRSGIRRLTLIDDDVIMPGNIVRHLVGPEMVGLAKVEAVKRYLVARRSISAEKIEVLDEAVTSGDTALALLKKHDLVIDATADFATTAMLHIMARSVNKRIVSATIQNNGQTFRIDLLPPFEGHEPLARSAITSESESLQLIEAGCGSPISQTPPYVAIDTAAAVVRHAISLLTGNPLDPAGEIQNFTINTARTLQ